MLDSYDIMDLVEGVDFEAKRATGRDGQGQLPESFFPSYSAMANTEGGVVLLGIDEVGNDRFEVIGISSTTKVVAELWSALNNKQKVSCNILNENDVSVIKAEGKSVIQVTIPRAIRFQMPVYIGKNPFEGTYRRQGQGDFRCDEETVKRMLAEQVEDARDAQLLERFSLADLHLPTVRAYRQAFKSVKPEHPWADLDNDEFLRNVGAWSINRETKRGGLTLGGLLMFGKLRSILDAIPNYVVDYQERPPDAKEDSDRRWIDRVTTDGTWSGNLYDFYRMVILRLTHDLKIPFKLKGTTRTDDTPVHEAIREALTNTIIHADFTGRMSLYVIKRQDMFGFRNPGLMRIPLDLAIQGGQSDCRNRGLQKMFQLVGLAEQAGSGLPKVYRNWNRQHWRRPELVEEFSPDQTILRLRMVSLLPEETLAHLDARFGRRFRELPETARLALACVAVEKSVTHARLKEMSSDHPKDLSKILAMLVEDGFVISKGATRGTIYYFPDQTPEDGIDVAPISVQKYSAARYEARLEQSRSRLEHSGVSLEHLQMLAGPVKTSKKAPRGEVRAVLVKLCRAAPLTAQQLAELINRDIHALKNHYLKPMVREGHLKLLYPDKPNHPSQAYVDGEASAETGTSRQAG